MLELPLVKRSFLYLYHSLKLEKSPDTVSWRRRGSYVSDIRLRAIVDADVGDTATGVPNTGVWYSESCDGPGDDGATDSCACSCGGS